MLVASGRWSLQVGERCAITEPRASVFAVAGMMGTLKSSCGDDGGGIALMCASAPSISVAQTPHRKIRDHSFVDSSKRHIR